MKKLLFISNICRGVSNLHIVSATASENVGYEFHFAANFTNLSKDMEANYPHIHFHHIDFIRFPFHPGNITAYFELKKLIQEISPDAIHCNTPVGGILGRLCGRRCHVKKIIYTAHGFHFYTGAPLINRTVFKWGEMLLAHWTDAIITINREDYVSAQKLNLRKHGKKYYLPGVGIDTILGKKYYIKRNMIRPEKRKELGIPLDKFVIISVGELNSNKNNEIIIRALAKVHISEIQYLMCGIGTEQRKLELLADKLGIKNQIHFLGYRTDIQELYQTADLFVMPSFREGLPRSLMEAMAAGLPCIVSNIRGNVDLIHNNINGILCDPKDETAFAKAIVNLFNNETVRTEMGRRNLDIIEDFDLNNVIGEMTEIYKEVADI